jgi:hypothetical protein
MIFLVVAEHLVSEAIVTDALDLQLVRVAGGWADDALVVAKLDRLSRSVMDFAGLMDRAQKEE